MSHPHRRPLNTDAPLADLISDETRAELNLIKRQRRAPDPEQILEVMDPIWKEYNPSSRIYCDVKICEMEDDHLFRALRTARERIIEHQEQIDYRKHSVQVFKRKERELLAEIHSRPHLSERLVDLDTGLVA